MSQGDAERRPKYKSLLNCYLLSIYYVIKKQSSFPDEEIASEMPSRLI